MLFGAATLTVIGTGNDKMTGGTGADAFRGGSGTNTVTDFDSAQGDTETRNL